MKPLLGLCMIVKNEAKRIVEVLASYRQHINTWTILDTGSTDGTQDLIRRELASIPGRLWSHQFDDFATSRNRAIDLHADVTEFTIMPNGDVLQGGAALVAFLSMHRDDRADAYRVRVSPGHYYHPLVMRTGRGWRYQGRTHECASGPNLGEMIEGVSVVRDRSSRTDKEWRERWYRDLDLLTLDINDAPSNPRSYFYMGQTYECLGQPSEALVYFKKRATMGGYFDEVYEAKYRIGKMKELIDHPWAESQQAYLEAHAYDPRRAEPLYEIAKHWYDLEQHAISRIFSVQAAELPKPTTDLFLDEEIYSWKAHDLASISSFYTHRIGDARRFAENAVRARPKDERLRANLAFCAPNVSQMFGAKTQAIDFEPPPGWNASNPSICADRDGRFRCIVRTVNYRIDPNGRYETPPDDNGVIRTRNFMLDLDETFEVERVREMEDRSGVPRTSFPIHGFEDARLFQWRDKWWATATVCDFTDGRREIALLEIDDNAAIVHAEPLRGPWSDRPQKNWIPNVSWSREHLQFVYALNESSTVFEVEDAERSHALPWAWVKQGRHAIGHRSDASFEHGRLRGGSQTVRISNDVLAIVHDVAFPGSGRIYLHRFVLLTHDMQIKGASRWFYFDRLGIEFCAGLAVVDDNHVVASFSVNDGSARLATFKIKRVMETIRGGDSINGEVL